MIVPSTKNKLLFFFLKDRKVLHQHLFSLDLDIFFSWKEWSDWSSCNKPCGGGSRKRSRECVAESVIKNNAKCNGENNEVKICNIHPCRGMIRSMKTLLSYYLKSIITNGKKRTPMQHQWAQVLEIDNSSKIIFYFFGPHTIFWKQFSPTLPKFNERKGFALRKSSSF